ncbi:glycosyltransferase family 2 protein [Candidatus Bathyarchaeota archaeon]|nr:glycosyltransferase family 2 protein [Candidatus Bathyarchaeota archaeon]
MKTFAVIPAYNEEKYVGGVVKDVKKHCDRVIVVDDGSRDETAKTAEDAGATVLKLSKNKGKGFALRTGTRRAVEEGADILVFIDADRQHRPGDIPKLLELLKGADIVFADRASGYMPAIKRFGNRFLNTMFSILFHSEAGDLLCGFKAFRKEALEDLMWKTDGYSVEIEMAARAGLKRLKTRHIEIPSIYLETSKGTGIWDGVTMAWNMLKIRFQLASESFRQ